MATTYGKLPEFCPDSGNIDVYLERFELFAKANGIDDGKKLEVFLTMIGEKAYVTLRSLLLPKTPTEVKYEDAKKVLQQHYALKRSVVTERYHFYRRNQESNETIAQFLVELKRLAATCSFGNFLQEALRDRLIAGLRSDTIRCRLLALPDDEVTWERVCKVATAMEAAQKDTQDMLCDSAGASNAQLHWQGSQGKPNATSQVLKKNYTQKTAVECHRCGGQHAPTRCPFLKSACFKCSKRGHVAKMCKTRVVQAVEVPATEQDLQDLLTICQTNRAGSPPPIVVKVIINGHEVPMELDTGAAVTIMSEKDFAENFPDLSYNCEDVKLGVYNGTAINVRGVAQVDVKCGKQSHRLPLVIAKYEEGVRMPVLLGRDWLAKIKVNLPDALQKLHEVALKVQAVAPLKTQGAVEALKQQHADVFQAGYGAIKGYKGSIRTKENAVPVFCKARPVPYALREQVEKELAELEKAEVIYRVRHSTWATPLVIVPKKNGSEIRICGDYRVSVNKCIEVDHYPLPLPEDIFASLVGGTVFTVLDLAKAYLQLELDEHAEELLTVNTHMGLFRYRRLPFGVASAPAMFQAVMDQVLHGIPGTACYLDDVLIAGKDLPECYKRTKEVLNALSKHGIRVNVAKCVFFQERVQYLGHEIDQHGLHPTANKVKAILEAPKPSNVTQLRAFLGLVNFYAKFLPNLAGQLEPLHQLLRKGSIWQWSRQCDECFRRCKQLLTKETVLELYDVKKEIQLTCDASAYGLGAVLSHVVNGVERPVAFASRSMSQAERNYAHIEKEALAIIFGVKKFHKYLYGRSFVIITDHQPLTIIFEARHHSSAVAAARVHRWAIFLSNYRFRIVHKPGAKISNADGLSRLPLSENTDDVDKIFYFSPARELPLTAKDIAHETSKDSVLSAVREMTWHGWPRSVEAQYQPFFVRRFELSVDDACLIWENRVVIPRALQQEVLLLLHEQHMGISKMKALARSMVWWPGIDSSLEQTVKQCHICQSVRPVGQPAPLTPWRWCTNSWERVHLDFAEKENKMFLVAVDSHSKWVDVKIMNSTTAQKTIETVRSLFASYGLPQEIVTDNGPQFRAKEFDDFLQANGVKHTLTPPYHPQSNGAAERAVQTVKQSLLKQLLEDERSHSSRSLQHRVDNFLFAYRTTPHTFTGKTPAELFLKRKLRTRLSLLKPDMEGTINSKSEREVRSANKRRGKPRAFSVGDRVLVRTVRGELVKWRPGNIVSVKSPVTYLVNVDKQTRFVHADHLRCTSVKHEEYVEDCGDEMSLPHASDILEKGNCSAQPPVSSPQPPHTPPILRRSTRVTRPPDRLMYH